MYVQLDIRTQVFFRRVSDSAVSKFSFQFCTSGLGENGLRSPIEVLLLP